MKFPQKIKNRITVWSSNPTLAIYPKELKSGCWRDSCTSRVLTELFTIANVWIQLKCSSMNKQIKKMLYVQTVEYYSAFKMEEMLPFLTTWMNLEGIVLMWNKLDTNTAWYHLYEESKIVRFIDTERMVAVRACS